MRRADFLASWHKRTMATAAGELTYMVFPVRRSFGSRGLAGLPIEPAETHDHLAALGHERPQLSFMGQDWADLMPLRHTV